jgi:hypothetical protein
MPQRGDLAVHDLRQRHGVTHGFKDVLGAGFLAFGEGLMHGVDEDGLDLRAGELLAGASQGDGVEVPRLARGFTKQSARVCGFVKHGLTLGLIEGFNNLIARIIHKACGMRDLDYLELKLRHRSVIRS